MGVASGDDGVLTILGKGDILACAATSGDLPALDLENKQFQVFISMFFE